MDWIPIIILNYNDVETTLNMVRKILCDEQLSKMLRVIIVDNCSKDNSYEVLIKELGNKCKILKSDRNGGYACGNNIGMRYAYRNMQSKYGIISNPDVEFTDETISSIIDVLKSDLNIKVASVMVVDGMGKNQLSAWKLPRYFLETATSLFWGYRLFDQFRYYREKQLKDPVLIVDVLPGSFFIYDSKAMNEIGFLNEKTFLYCEENILAYNMKKAGYKTALLTNFTYIHYHNMSIGKSYINTISRYKLHQESRKIYFTECLNVSKFKLKLFDMITWVGILERKIGGKFLT